VSITDDVLLSQWLPRGQLVCHPQELHQGIETLIGIQANRLPLAPGRLSANAEVLAYGVREVAEVSCAWSAPGL
jgi:hypothetical protein